MFTLTLNLSSGEMITNDSAYYTPQSTIEKTADTAIRGD